MSHLALARKWRPQRFEDVIGQRGVVDTLKNAISTGRLAQSFIFAGPRGVGKTTTARILARALNCVDGPTGEPCGKCDACVEIAEGRDMDVLEIDAATHTQVDHVREVIVEPLAIAPMRDRFKVFIIDEVHRLSKNAFDALLKSVEEPPPYVKFMMATTELHAVPVTIQSRSQVFELRALPFTSIRDQLRSIIAREKVTIDDAAVALVARSAEGSMRDALSSLDQVLAFKNDAITANDVSTVLGLIGRDQQFEVAEIVAREDLAGAFTVAGAVIEAGFDPRIVCRELARLMRDLLVIRIDPTRASDPEIAAEGEAERLKALAASYSREDLMRAFDLLSRAEFEIRSSSQPRHQFEMALVKWIHLRQLTPIGDLIVGLSGNREIGSSGNRSATPASAVPRTDTGTVRTDVRRPEPTTKLTNQQAPSPGPKADLKAPRNLEDPKDRPPDFKSVFLSAIREQHKTFHSMVVAQAQKVEVDGNTVVFTFAPVHKSMRAQLDSRKAALEELASSAAGRRITIVSRESAPVPVAAGDDPAAARRADLAARAKAEPAVQAVLDVFGGEIEDVEELDK